MEDLINKLPHGDTWWNLENNIIQSINEAKPIKEVNEVKPNKEVTPIKEVKEVTPIKEVMPTSEVNVNRKQNKVIEKDKLYNTIILGIDDLASLYTDNMKRDAEMLFREELKIFINEVACLKRLFISSKLRVIMNWLNGNKINNTSLYIIKQFINWFLSTDIIDDEHELKYIDKTTDIYVVKICKKT
jgi:hypothetical protein